MRLYSVITLRFIPAFIDNLRALRALRGEKNAPTRGRATAANSSLLTPNSSPLTLHAMTALPLLATSWRKAYYWENVLVTRWGACCVSVAGRLGKTRMAASSCFSGMLEPKVSITYSST